MTEIEINIKSYTEKCDNIHLLLLRRRKRRPINALRDRLVEQLPTLPATTRHKMQLHRAPTRTFAVDRNLARVATKARNVLLDPLERLDLVEEACVEVSVRTVAEGRVCKESKGGEAIVHGDDDDVGALGHPVVEGPISGVAVNVASAMNVDQNGYCSSCE